MGKGCRVENDMLIEVNKEVYMPTVGELDEHKNYSVSRVCVEIKKLCGHAKRLWKKMSQILNQCRGFLLNNI